MLLSRRLKLPAPKPLSRPGATARPNAILTGTATKRETSSSDSSIGSNSSGASRRATTSSLRGSMRSCISHARISGYCERALEVLVPVRHDPASFRVFSFSATENTLLFRWFSLVVARPVRNNTLRAGDGLRRSFGIAQKPRMNMAPLWSN